MRAPSTNAKFRYKAGNSVLAARLLESELPSKKCRYDSSTITNNFRKITSSDRYEGNIVNCKKEFCLYTLFAILPA